MQVRQRLLEDKVLTDASLHPVILRLYAVRGLTTVSDISLDLDQLIPPTALTRMEHAVALMEEQLLKQGHILLVGDFDADGATSSALGVLCLKAMGFQQVSYLVPNRFEYGYGLTPEIAAVACELKPDLIMTVDNGVSSHAGVKLAREKGVKVLVTDHHLPGETLPEADCILNPNLRDCDFPSKALAGVGVVFYLMLALRSRLRGIGWFEKENIPEPNLANYLDIVALGTVADVVPLDRNNRCLVKHGLRIIQGGKGRAGIRALLGVANRDLSILCASDLGFAAGPRLNAAGRLDDMSLGIECLLCEDEQQAWRIARLLDELNKDRRNIEQTMQEQALAFLESVDEQPDEFSGICLYNTEWHQGVIGILASRMKDRFHRPSIVFADAGDGQLIKGSARSIPGLHMRDLLESIATRHPHLIKGFGGHAMAAGLSIAAQHFEEFEQAYQQQLAALLDDEMLSQTLWTDGELEHEYLTLEFAQTLKDAGPWGQHFSEPLFEGCFPVLQQRILAERHLKLTLDVPGHARGIDAIAFNVADGLLSKKHQQVDLVYRLTLNAWNGRVSPQLQIELIRQI